MRTSFIISSLAVLVLPNFSISAPMAALTPRDTPSTIQLHNFAIKELGDLSYIPTGHLIDRTTNVTNEGIGYNWGCTNSTGPDPLDCPAAISQWQDLSTPSSTPINLTIPSGRCISIPNKSCLSFACALQDDIFVSSELVSSRLMNPAQTRCVVTGKAGVWENGERGGDDATLKVGLVKDVFAWEAGRR